MKKSYTKNKNVVKREASYIFADSFNLFSRVDSWVLFSALHSGFCDMLLA